MSKKPSKIKKPRNLSAMIQELDGVEITVSDIEQLALQLVLESPDAREKVNALKVLVEIKKHLDKDENEKELLDILSKKDD